MWVSLEIAIQNRGKPRDFGRSYFLCSTVTEKVVCVFSRNGIESYCLCKLAQWDGAAGNGHIFSLQGRRKDQKDHVKLQAESSYELPYGPFPLFQVMF